MPKRKYEITAEDDMGDIHAFYTDDRERADEMLELMREDLDNAELVEHS